jgi:hypothetical protein
MINSWLGTTAATPISNKVEVKSSSKENFVQATQVSSEVDYSNPDGLTKSFQISREVEGHPATAIVG